jgi:ABC-type Zn uptake system ZnuABC Zn-binding protein ZnuA
VDWDDDVQDEVEYQLSVQGAAVITGKTGTLMVFTVETLEKWLDKALASKDRRLVIVTQTKGIQWEPPDSTTLN